jgi:hypothetical protein
MLFLSLISGRRVCNLGIWRHTVPRRAARAVLFLFLFLSFFEKTVSRNM